MQREMMVDRLELWAFIDRRRFLALAGVVAGGLGMSFRAAAAEREEGLLAPPEGSPSLGLETEFLFTRRNRVRREIVGPVAEGFRVNIYTGSGHVRGPKLNGVTGEGGDWFTIRRDGMGIVDSRVMIHAEEDALIYTYYTGVTDFGADAYERIVRGEVPEPGKVFIAARFQTAHPGYRWLNRVQAVGVGVDEGASNLWDTYALR